MSCKFGSYNTKTGETKEGYMEAGQMKFRPIPWWKRIFVRIHEIKLPVEMVEEYIGTTELTAFTRRREWNVEVAVYRRYNKWDGKTDKIWFIGEERRHYFNPDAWDKDKKLVLEK